MPTRIAFYLTAQSDKNRESNERDKLKWSVSNHLPEEGCLFFTPRGILKMKKF